MGAGVDKGRWRILYLILAIMLLARCFLPGATVIGDDADGGATDGSTDGANGDAQPNDAAGSDAADANVVAVIVPPQPLIADMPALVGNPSLVTAQSGTAGQRHLIFANGSWWLFYANYNDLVPVSINAVGLADSDIAVAAAADAGLPWLDAGVAFDLNPAVSFVAFGLNDGRNFGTAIFPVNATTSVLHFAMSEGNEYQLQLPLQHARCILSGTTLTCQPPEKTLGPWDSAYGADGGAFLGAWYSGIVTSIGGAGTVQDFTSDSIDSGAAQVPQCTSCAIGAAQADDGGTSAWSFGMGTRTAVDGMAQGLGTTSMRAVVALPSRDFLFWRASGDINAATRASSGSWARLPNLESSSATSDDARTFAACAQATTGHLLYWSGTSFVFTTIQDGDGSFSSAAAPGNLPDLRDLVLVCGKNRVHAFAIAGASVDAGLDTYEDVTYQVTKAAPILGATWDPSGGWSSWATVALSSAPQPTGYQRCFLTAFDHVAGVSGDEVGLAYVMGFQCETNNNSTNVDTAFAKTTD